MSAYKKLLEITYKQLSNKLNIREDFILSIYEDQNSWSFISKLAQLVEGVFTKILVQRLDEPEILDTISRLSQATRIELAHDLQIIAEEQKHLFRTVAEIRNSYIHNISNIDVDLSEYLSSLAPSRQKDIFKKIKPFIHTNEELDLESFIGDSRKIIFIAVSHEIARVNGKIDSLFSARKHDGYRSSQAQKLLPKKLSGDTYFDDRTKIDDHVKKAQTILKENGLL